MVQCKFKVRSIAAYVHGLAKNGNLITSSRNKDMKMNSDIKDDLLPSAHFLPNPMLAARAVNLVNFKNNNND